MASGRRSSRSTAPSRSRTSSKRTTTPAGSRISRRPRGKKERPVRGPALQRHRHLQDHRGGVVAPLALVPDPRLSTRLDELIQLIAESQEKDGYLFPRAHDRSAAPGAGRRPERWIYENGSHELYNARAISTKRRSRISRRPASGSLLDVAIRNADLVCRTFGPNGRHAVSGHEEIELALVKLYRATGNATYLKTARVARRRARQAASRTCRRIRTRRSRCRNDRAYKQDQAPVVDAGSRGRATPCARCSCMKRSTDVAALTDNDAFAKAADRLWQDVVSQAVVSDRRRRRAWHHGVVRRRLRAAQPSRLHRDLRVGRQRSLEPARCSCCMATASTSTCSSAMLYNGVLAGVSLAGNTFFYQNPLESNGRAKRTGVFRGGLLPGEPGPHAGAAARSCLSRRPQAPRQGSRQARSTRTSTSAITPT